MLWQLPIRLIVISISEQGGDVNVRCSAPTTKAVVASTSFILDNGMLIIAAEMVVTDLVI